MEKVRAEYGTMIKVAHLPTEMLRTISQYPYTTDLCRAARETGLLDEKILFARGVTDTATQSRIREAVKQLGDHPLPRMAENIAACFHVLFDAFPVERQSLVGMYPIGQVYMYFFTSNPINLDPGTGIAPPSYQEGSLQKEVTPSLPHNYDVAINHVENFYSIFKDDSRYAEQTYDLDQINTARLNMVHQIVSPRHLTVNRHLQPPSSETNQLKP